MIKKPDGTYPSYEELKAAYDKYYAKERFVRVLKKGVCPETKWVEGSNYVDVNFVIDERTGRVVMMGALDNLVKGAAGQAVQNMNLLFGFDEAEGLSMVPIVSIMKCICLMHFLRSLFPRKRNFHTMSSIMR